LQHRTWGRKNIFTVLWSAFPVKSLSKSKGMETPVFKTSPFETWRFHAAGNPLFFLRAPFPWVFLGFHHFRCEKIPETGF